LSRSEKSKRRTKTVINTCGPQWNQSFVYSSFRHCDLRTRVLEVTVWDYDRFGANEFLGEVVLGLGGTPTSSSAGGLAAPGLWHELSNEQSHRANGAAEVVSERRDGLGHNLFPQHRVSS
jgi:hypothetical protein